MTEVAPSCPISHDGPHGRHGDPWSPIGTLQDAINSIPKATDLPSVIRALNIMNNIVQRINRGEPMVNNIRVDKQPDIRDKGEDYRNQYGKLDWVEEIREFKKQKLYNPDNETQFIEISVLKTVKFYNPNTDYRLTYYKSVA